MEVPVLAIFLVLGIGAVMRPTWALTLAMLMYPLEQSLQGAVGIFRAIPALARSCCRWSALTKWWSTIRMPAAAAARCCREKIQRRCAIR